MRSSEWGKHLFIWGVLVFAFFPLYVTFAISVKNNKQFNQSPFAPLPLSGIVETFEAGEGNLVLQIVREHHFAKVAEVTGNTLEDEKAGFHWAFGRSDHIGGVVGVEDFQSPETVVHQDIVYAKGSPVEVESAVLMYPDGRRVSVIVDTKYVY